MSEPYFMPIAAEDLSNWTVTGGPDYADSVYDVGVLEPILIATWEGKEYLVAGNRRVASFLAAHAKAEADGTLADKPFLNKIPAMVYPDVSPFDRAYWSLIENEQRGENIILTWETIKSLQAEGRWDEVRQLINMNKGRADRFRLLDQAAPELIDAYRHGQISASNLFAAARLGARQNELVSALGRREGKEKRITGNDLVAAKYASNQATLASLNHFNLDVPVVPPPPVLFVVLIYDEQLGWSTVWLGENYQEGQRSAQAQSGRLFKLVEV